MKMGNGAGLICFYGRKLVHKDILYDFQCKCWTAKPLDNRDDSCFILSKKVFFQAAN